MAPAMKLTPIVSVVLVLPGGARTMQQRSLRGRGVAGSAALGTEPAVGLDFGSADCPCIGFQGVGGELQAVVGNGTSAPYPAEFGSFCNAWDDAVHPLSCQDGQEPGQGNGWCARSWCFVDACNCHGTAQPPHVTKMMPNVDFRGKPLYYSYSTCGDEDLWTKDHNEKACTNKETEQECEEDVDMNCVWGETHWGQKCLGWEAGGLCMDLPEESAWGKHDCPCIGFDNANGTITVNFDTQVARYPGGLGSTCQKWDQEHHPDCLGEDVADFCAEPWCFVDPRNCDIEDKPEKSMYLPDATFQGRPVHYSYATCGGKEPRHPVEAPVPANISKDEAADTVEDPEDQIESVGAPAGSEAGTGIGVDFDDDAYADEWHKEWAHGDVPSFRDMHPEVKPYVDRQSDGKPSPVF